VVLVLLLTIAAGCGSAQPTAPSEFSVTLSAVSELLPPGGSTQVSARVTDQGGSPAPDGTIVRFTASAGRVQPAEAPTVRGVAVTTFFVSDAEGPGEVRAAANGGPVSNTVQFSVAAFDVLVSVNAVNLGGRNVLATVDVQGGVAVQFEWFFERRSTPEVVTTTNEARYAYASPGFKDLTVRVTFADGRRALASGAVVVE
jgi:hypothetical protein